MMHKSKYVTNDKLEKDVGCKVLQLINTMKITKLLGYKTLQRTMQQLLEEKDELGQIVFDHNMFVKNLCIKLHSPASAVTALKIIIVYV